MNQGYLFFADLLGTKSLLAYNPELVDPMLSRLGNEAARIQRDLDSGRRDSRLAILGDSVFYYSPRFRATVRFAIRLAESMSLMPIPNGGPGLLRGGVGGCEGSPTFRAKTIDRMSLLQVVSPALVEALVTESARVSGARLLVAKSDLEIANYHRWSPRDQSYLTDFSTSPTFSRGSSLTSELALPDLCDLLWMNTDSNNRFQKIRSAVMSYVYSTIVDPRIGKHVAATATLLRATEIRRRGIVVILRQLRAGHLPGTTAPPSKDYEAWLKLAPRIAAARRATNQEFVLPIDFTLTLSEMLKKDKYVV